MPSFLNLLPLFIAAAGFLLFGIAHLFAIVIALGIDRKSGVISLFVPFFAFMVCYRHGRIDPEAYFPVKMGAASLAVCLAMGMFMLVLFETHSGLFAKP